MEKKKPGVFFWTVFGLVMPGGVVILILIFGKKTIQTNPTYIGANSESMGAAVAEYKKLAGTGSLPVSFFSGYQGLTVYSVPAGGYLITGNPGIILPSQVIPYWWIASKGLFGSLSKGVGYLIYTFIPKFIANVWNRILPK